MPQIRNGVLEDQSSMDLEILPDVFQTVSRIQLNIRPSEISIQKHGRLFFRFDIMLKLWVQAKFLHVKRLPPPLKPKGHSMHNTALLKAAKAVLSQTMNDAQASGFSFNRS